MARNLDNVELKVITDRLYKNYMNIDQALLLCFKGFVSHKAENLREASAIISEIRVGLKTTVSDVQKIKEKTEKIDNIVFVIPGHTDRVLTNLSTLIEATSRKIGDSILFSEKAVNELRSLYASTRGIVRDLADLILTNNAHLAVFVVEQSAKIISEADKYSTEHEERLVNGVCSLASCSVYLDILESLKNSSWHIKQAAERVKKQELL